MKLRNKTGPYRRYLSHLYPADSDEPDKGLADRGQAKFILQGPFLLPRFYGKLPGDFLKYSRFSIPDSANRPQTGVGAQH